jgi:hypothetical protein
VFSENGFKAAHLLFRQRLADHTAFYFVQVLVYAVEDAVGVGFYLGAEIGSDFVGPVALIDVFGIVRNE